MMSLLATSYVSRKGGMGEEGGSTGRVIKAWLCLGSAVERHWLALGGLS